MHSIILPLRFGNYLCTNLSWLRKHEFWNPGKLFHRVKTKQENIRTFSGINKTRAGDPELPEHDAFLPRILVKFHLKNLKFGKDSCHQEFCLQNTCFVKVMWLLQVLICLFGLILETPKYFFPQRQLKPHRLYICFQHKLAVTYHADPHVHLLVAYFLVETIVGSLVRIQVCSLYTNIKILL